MSDQLATLPPDDEDPLVILEEFVEFVEAETGLDLQDLADPLRALGAANADEYAVLYGLLRERLDDVARDFGRLYGVADPQPVPALAQTSWTARADRAGVLVAGQELVIDAPQGLTPFEVLVTTDVPAGQTVVGITVQALTPGAAANQATGPVMLDVKPSWVAAVTVTEPASGGADALSSLEHLEQVRRAALLQAVAPVNDVDLELRLLDIPGIARVLVRDNFDLPTGQTDVEGVATTWPLDAAGEGVATSSVLTLTVTRARILEVVSGGSRRLLNGVTHVGAPTYCPIGAAVSFSLEDGYDAATAQAGAEAAMAAVLDPAVFGQPRLGQQRRWRLRRFVRHYEVAAAVNGVDGVREVLDLTLTAGANGSVTSDGDVLMSGFAPLPRAGAMTAAAVLDA